MDDPMPAIAGKTRYPLNPYRLTLAGRDWTVLNAKQVFTRAEEADYFARVKTTLPYGVALWPSCLSLAHELAARADALPGRSVLELGAGVGFPGLVARHLGADVVQTDVEPMALGVCSLNAQVNGIAGVTCRLGDWADWDDPAVYDYVIGSDVLYAVPLHKHLLQLFRTNLAPGGHVLIADPGRIGNTEFFETLIGEGWDVGTSYWRMDLPDDPAPYTVCVYDMQPPAS